MTSESTGPQAKVRPKWLLPTLVIVVLAVVAVTIWFATRPKPASEATVGFVLPLTGPVGAFGTWAQNGATLAAEHVNSEGVIRGGSLRLVFEDSQNEGGRGLSAARKLLSADGADVLVCGMSRVCLPLITVAESNSVPLLMQDVTYPGVTGRSATVFRHFVQSDREARILLEYAASELSVRRLSVLHVNDEAGVGARDAIRQRAETLGVEVVAVAAFEGRDTDVRSHITSILAENPDAVYIFGNGPSWAAAVRQIREANSSVRLLTNTAMYITPFRSLAGETAVEGVYFTFPRAPVGDPTPGQERFEQLYRQRFGESPPLEASYAWDLVHFIAMAVSQRQTEDTAVQNSGAISWQSPGNQA